MALWGKTDNNASKPKYVSGTGVLGIDVAEAKTTANIAKGLNTPGWVKYSTYTDAQGNTRNKAEVLVAMSSLTGDNDTIAPEITITVQPSNASAVEGETESFSVTATRTGSGSLTYQWQKSDDAGTTWNNIVGATSAAYTTGALTVADDDADKYRVVVSLTGAESVTSTAATLTVTAPE